MTVQGFVNEIKEKHERLQDFLINKYSEAKKSDEFIFSKEIRKLNEEDLLLLSMFMKSSINTSKDEIKTELMKEDLLTIQTYIIMLHQDGKIKR